MVKNMQIGHSGGYHKTKLEKKNRGYACHKGVFFVH